MGKRTILGFLVVILAVASWAADARADGVDPTYQYTAAGVRAKGTPIFHSFSWSDPPTDLTPPWWMGATSHWYDSLARTYSTIHADRIYHSSTMTTDPSSGSYAYSSTYVRFVADGDHDYVLDGLFHLSNPGASCYWYVTLVDETTGQYLYYAYRSFYPATEFYDGLGGGYASGSITGRLVDGHRYRFTFYSRMSTVIVGSYAAGTAWATLDLEPVTPEQLLSELADDIEDLLGGGELEESLTAKVENALSALQDDNADNDVSAANRLGAFKNQVEAQRGKQLTDAEADAFIAAANEILDRLGT